MEEVFLVNDPSEIYKIDSLIYREEVFSFISCCFEVHKVLGKGFLEAVYKDALVYELKRRDISFEREKKYQINYKDAILPHYYISDFIIHDKIIIEIKAQKAIEDSHYKQVINYLAVSKLKLGLLINFGEDDLKFKRIIL